MDLTLAEIRDILSYEDFGKIIEMLKRAEKSADEKIAELGRAKAKIQRARTFYENKLKGEEQREFAFVKEYPQRVILLSDTLKSPTLFTDAEGLKVLPRGRYLCADCAEEERGRVLAKLTDTAKSDYGAEPGFALQLIVLSGILQWNYQVQIPIP